jgi:thiamine-monophosphate kinase
MSTRAWFKPGSGTTQHPSCIMSPSNIRNGTSIRRIGEFGLIELIKRRICSKDKRVLVNIGDDAAVIKSSSDKLLIFTTDTMVEKVHFDLRYCAFEEIGWKAMTANLSDVAAMGGVPTWALVTVGLPRSMQAQSVLSIYKGASTIARKHGCRIIGGDTTLVPKHLFVSIALLGEVEKKALVTRSGARQGDFICVTGTLGETLAGYRYLRRYGRKRLSLVRKHLKPEPRINQARELVGKLRVNSMIDISDGLSSELFHLAEESHLGVLIHESSIPVSPKCTKLATLLGANPLEWALSSGEEYELLFTVDRKDRGKLDRIKSNLGVSIIGRIVDQKQGLKIVRETGAALPLKKSGFVHF